MTLGARDIQAGTQQGLAILQALQYRQSQERQRQMDQERRTQDAADREQKAFDQGLEFVKAGGDPKKAQALFPALSPGKFDALVELSRVSKQKAKQQQDLSLAGAGLPANLAALQTGTGNAATVADTQAMLQALSGIQGGGEFIRQANLGAIGARSSARAGASAAGEERFGKEFNRAYKLNQQYVKLTAEPQAVVTSLDAIRTLSRIPQNGPRDNALIMQFARMNEPGGRLSDEDFARQAKAGTLPQIAQAYYNQMVKNGGKLPPEVANQLVDAAEKLARPQLDKLERRTVEFRRKARRLGLNPDDVVSFDFGPSTQAPKPPKAPPKPPASESGAVFVDTTTEGGKLFRRPDGSVFEVR